MAVSRRYTQIQGQGNEPDIDYSICNRSFIEVDNVACLKIVSKPARSTAGRQALEHKLSPGIESYIAQVDGQVYRRNYVLRVVFTSIDSREFSMYDAGKVIRRG